MLPGSERVGKTSLHAPELGKAPGFEERESCVCSTQAWDGNNSLVESGVVVTSPSASPEGATCLVRGGIPYLMLLPGTQGRH